MVVKVGENGLQPDKLYVLMRNDLEDGENNWTTSTTHNNYDDALSDAMKRARLDPDSKFAVAQIMSVHAITEIAPVTSWYWSDEALNPVQPPNGGVTPIRSDTAKLWGDNEAYARQSSVGIMNCGDGVELGSMAHPTTVWELKNEVFLNETAKKEG